MQVEGLRVEGVKVGMDVEGFIVVGSLVGSSVGLPVGSCVGLLVGSCVGLLVGFCEGNLEG